MRYPQPKKTLHLNKTYLRLSSWIRLSKCWNAWCVVLISYLLKPWCHHYGCNDTSSGPYWSCECESVPFYCCQCLSTDRQHTCSSQDPTQSYHSPTGSRKKKTIRCSQCNRPFHLFCVKISRKHANKLPGWYCNACDPILNSPHPQEPQLWVPPWLTPLPLALIFNP